MAPLPASELKAIFDLSKHPGAQDYTALAMLSRLDKDVRRTGIEGTLHRISRNVHAVTKGTVGITVQKAQGAESGQVVDAGTREVGESFGVAALHAPHRFTQ